MLFSVSLPLTPNMWCIVAYCCAALHCIASSAVIGLATAGIGMAVFSWPPGLSALQPIIGLTLIYWSQSFFFTTIFSIFSKIMGPMSTGMHCPGGSLFLALSAALPHGDGADLFLIIRSLACIYHECCGPFLDIPQNRGSQSDVAPLQYWDTIIRGVWKIFIFRLIFAFECMGDLALPVSGPNASPRGSDGSAFFSLACHSGIPLSHNVMLQAHGRMPSDCPNGSRMMVMVGESALRVHCVHVP